MRQTITSDELRAKYMAFFKEKGHTVIPGASLIPENDPSVLFTTAGMHPLVPFLLGEKHPAGVRLTNCQRCIRTGDIDEVGDDWHLTFFEMLGNWSLGDYFKEDAIKYSWEFLTDKKWLGLKKENIAITVFAGDEDASFDEESYKKWSELGVPEAKIKKLGKDDNWWPAGGRNPGPQGPCTEMFYWLGKGDAPKKFDPSDKQWVEIWNDVFMQYNRTPDGKFEPLKQKNVDTGMGLERTVAILNDFDNVYKTDGLKSLVGEIINLAGVPKEQQEEFYQSNKKAICIIADHIRAAAFILGDHLKITPSNLGQGYVLRRLIRRAVRFAKTIGIDTQKEVTFPLAMLVVKIYGKIYPELEQNKEYIASELHKEEEKFEKTLNMGLKEFQKMTKDNKVNGQEAFILFSTYGFPWEMTQELAQEKGIKINKQEFEQEFKKHQELSRTASAGMFKGGLADTSEQTKKLHTAAHLLMESLRRTLGPHVAQKGSNITPERLRLDFSHAAKLSESEIKQISELVNEQIQKKLPVRFMEMSLDKARELGATGVFEHKYGDVVKVYFVGEEGDYFSKEICGGPHVENTGELGVFKITKEEASSAGVRRIKAVLE